MLVWLRHTLSTALIAGFVTGMVFLGHAERMSRSSLLCERLVVEFADNYRFVNGDDVKAIILNKYGIYFNSRIDSLRLDEIERQLCSHTAITDCQAWSTDDGNLHVRISQRKPAVRFMDGENGFYADENGYVFPLYQRFTAKTPVISGPLPQDSTWIADAAKMALFMTPIWEDKADSIGVDIHGSLTMRFGTPELFTFGKPEDYVEKFRKVKDYFDIVKSPDKEYTTIDLTYNKQLVCR
ncbi:MAG: hypothetical protein MJY41_01740 [Bacteroidales bacterium]|nr:hypothetical protein [Bacteroidales bacterium]